MPCKIKGIEYPFKYRSSTEIQPGSVPGGGGTYDEYSCDICGWTTTHTVYGQFFDGDEKDFFDKLIQDIEFHQVRCKARLEEEDGAFEKGDMK